MILLSFTYSGKARFFPLVFGCATLILVAFQLLTDCFSALEKKFTFVGQKGVFSNIIERDEKEKKSTTETKEGGLPLSKVIRLFLWLIGLTCGLRFFNYVAVSSVFIFLLIIVEARARLINALVVALCTGLFIFLLFGMVLKVNFQT